MWGEDERERPGTAARVLQHIDKTPLFDTASHNKIVGLTDAEAVFRQRNHTQHVVKHADATRWRPVNVTSLDTKQPWGAPACARHHERQALMCRQVFDTPRNASPFEIMRRGNQPQRSILQFARHQPAVGKRAESAHSDCAC